MSVEAAVVVALLLAVFVGFSLGLLGGGGSILTVPILTYVVGMGAKEAIASSLFIVGATSAFSVLSHARAGRVRWRTGAIFGAAGMVGAFIGGLIGGFVPGTVLMVLFAGMMLATAAAMIRGRAGHSATTGEQRTRRVSRIMLDGFLVGLATGLVGAGGGFLIVPALNLLGGLPIAVAVGTSLLVIVMKSFAGLAGYLFTVSIQWPLVLGFTGVAIAGSFIGSRFAGRIPETALRKGFGYFVLVMGAVVLVQELPRAIGLLT